MSSLQKATQGLVDLNNNGQDGAVEEQDQVKTQASLQGNRRDGVPADDDQDLDDEQNLGKQEAKQNLPHSPLLRGSNTQDGSIISSISSPLIMTPSSQNFKLQDEKILGEESSLTEPPTTIIIQQAATISSSQIANEGPQQNINNILDTQQQQEIGTADEQQDDQIQPQTSRSTDVSLPTDIGQDDQNSLNNGNSNNEIQSNMFQNLITNQQLNLKYFDELQQRISFLIYIFINGDIKISQNHVQMLWDSLVVFGFSEIQKNQFFDMFAQLLYSSPSNATGIRGVVTLPPAFSQQTVDMLYYDTLLRLKFKDITPQIYVCFERFFLFVNSQFGAILLLSQYRMASGSAISAIRQQQQSQSLQANRDQIEVFNIKLVGMEALWEIVLQAKDKTVAKLSSEFLRKLYRRLAKSVIQNSLINIKDSFVDTVMAQIAAGVQRIKSSQSDQEEYQDCKAFNEASSQVIQNQIQMKKNKERSTQSLAAGQELIHHLQTQNRITVGDAKQRISKVIEIIMDFLYEFQGLGDKGSHSHKHRGWNRDNTDDQSKFIALKVRLTNSSIAKNGDNFIINMPQNNKLGQLKQLILQSISQKLHPNELQIFFSGIQISSKSDDMSIKQCGLKNESTLLISKADFFEYQSPQNFNLGGSSNNQSKSLNAFQISDDQMKMVLEITAGIYSEQFIQYFAKKKQKNYQGLVSSILDIDQSQADSLINQMNAQKQEQMAKKLQEMANQQQAAAENYQQVVQTKMSLMIANRDYNFNLVFELLNLNLPEISVPVWKLINLLPVNRLKLEQMRSLQYQERPKWDQILDSKSMFKLLYALQIINGFILPGQKSIIGQNNKQENQKQNQQGAEGQVKEVIDSISQRDNWRYKFLQNGGCDHLYKILMNFEYKQIQEGSFEIQCLSQLLNIIKIFIQAALLSDAKQNDLLRNFLLQRRILTNFGTSSQLFIRKNSSSSFTSSFTAGGKSFGPGNQATPSLGGGQQQQNYQQSSYQLQQHQPNGSQIANAINGIGMGPKIDQYGGNRSLVGIGNGSNTPNFAASPISTPPPEANRSGSGPSSVVGGVVSNAPQKQDQTITIVEQLSKSGKVKLILKIMNLQDLICKLLTFLCKQGSSQNLNQQDCKGEGPKKSSMDNLILNAIDLVLPCILYNPLLLKNFYEFEYKNQSIEKIIVRILAAYPSERVRKKLEQMIRIIAVNINEDSFYQEEQQQQAQDDIIADTIAATPSPEDSKSQNPEIHKIPQCQKQSQGKPILQSPRVFFLNILLKNLPNQEDESGFCDQYFTVLTALLRLCTPTELEDIVSLSELFNTCLDRMRNRKIIETNNTEDPPDKIMIGFLTILTVILEIRQDFKSEQSGVFKPSQLINLLFDYLFKLPNQEDAQLSLPKIKASQTRRKAFILLNQLCRNENQNFKQLLFRMTKQQLNEFAENDSQQTSNNKQLSQREDQNTENNQNNQKYPYMKQNFIEWDIPVRSSVSNYVGLRNFGCTCYINSLLQQLYMIPNIRWGFLKEKVPDLSHPQAGNYSLLVAMQEIFANLYLSAMQFYQPTRFMQVFKMYGETINVRQQQDADQFFSLLGDQLQGQSKNIKKLLRNQIGSTLIHEIKSLESQYPYTSKREAEQIRISLEIKNKKSIHEALDFFVKGDILQGENKYMCDEHNRKIKAVKRCYLGQLSKTLVIHLKRFEFDMTTMMRYKVNDYCEFPTVLDLRPWTEQGIRLKEMRQQAAAKEEEKKQDADQDDVQGANLDSNNNDYTYNLVGVLIHSGSSEAGHYYSYIKDRESERGGWFEFNDTQVRPFDLANLKKSWFGGELQEGDAGYGSIYSEFYGGGKDGKAMRSNNAYLLFYEKAQKQYDNDVREQEESCKSDISVKGTQNMQQQEQDNIIENDLQIQDLIQDNTKNGEGKNKLQEEKKFDLLKNPQPILIKGVPKPLYNIIISQNNVFLKMRQIADTDFIQFLRQFLNLGEQQNEQSLQIDRQDSLKYQLKQIKNFSQQYKIILVRFLQGYYDQNTYAYLQVERQFKQELEQHDQYKKMGICNSLSEINLEIQDEYTSSQPQYHELISSQRYYQKSTQYGSALNISNQQIICKVDYIQFHSKQYRPNDQQLRKRVKSEASLYTLKLGTIFAYRVLSQQRDTSQFVNLMTSFRSQYQFHAKASIWLFTHFEQNLMCVAHLMFSNNEDIRQSFLSLLCTVSRKAFHAEEKIFYTYITFPTISVYETDLYN